MITPRGPQIRVSKYCTGVVLFGGEGTQAAQCIPVHHAYLSLPRSFLERCRLAGSSMPGQMPPPPVTKLQPSNDPDDPAENFFFAVSSKASKILHVFL